MATSILIVTTGNYKIVFQKSGQAAFELPAFFVPSLATAGNCLHGNFCFTYSAKLKEAIAMSGVGRWGVQKERSSLFSVS